jgi:HK97 family phage portal protein
MAWFDWLRRNQKTEGKSATLTINDVVRQVNGGDLPISLSLKIETVFAALRDKSETIGQLPIKLYETSKKGRKEIKSGRVHRIFCERPCDYMTMQTFMENLVVSLERFGAFYAYIERNDLGSPMSIVPFRFQGNIHPNMDVSGRVFYNYVKNDGTIGDAYNLEDLFIIKGFTLDGFTPVSPLVQNARLLGIANAQEETALETQTDGITSRMYGSTPNGFKDDNKIARLQEQIKTLRGPKGSSSIPIFEEDLKFHSFKLTPAETELLKNREFTVNRICRVFRVPVHRVGVTGTGAGLDIEKENEEYLRSSLNPILVKVEKALNSLLPPGYEIEFDRNAFYAGSPWRLVEHVEKGVKGGLYSINEGRNALGEEPVEGGDVYCVDNNNVVYSSWDKLEEMQERLYGANNQPKPTEDKPDGQ